LKKSIIFCGQNPQTYEEANAYLVGRGRQRAAGWLATIRVDRSKRTDRGVAVHLG
jgi:hypothetical protein